MAYSGRYHPGNSRPPAPPETGPRQEGGAPRPPAGPAHGLQGILKKIEAVGLETDDLILALILYLMYRESGDRDLLIMLGAMLLS